MTDMSEPDRRLNVESNLLAVVSSYGGERIVAGPRMEELVRELADMTESLARGGFLPAAEPGPPGLRPPATRDQQGGET